MGLFKAMKEIAVAPIRVAKAAKDDLTDDDAAAYQENAPRAPAETLCADFNRRGDYRLRDDRRLKWA